MKRVRIYYLEDWYGLYIDGKLVDEGHQLQVSDFVYHLKDDMNFDFSDRYDKSIDDALYAADLSHMPKTEEELLSLVNDEVPTAP